MKAKIEMVGFTGMSALWNPAYILSTDYSTFRAGDVAEKGKGVSILIPEILFVTLEVTIFNSEMTFVTLVE